MLNYQRVTFVHICLISSVLSWSNLAYHHFTNDNGNKLKAHFPFPNKLTWFLEVDCLPRNAHIDGGFFKKVGVYSGFREFNCNILVLHNFFFNYDCSCVRISFLRKHDNTEINGIGRVERALLNYPLIKHGNGKSWEIPTTFAFPWENCPIQINQATPPGGWMENPIELVLPTLSSNLAV